MRDSLRNIVNDVRNIYFRLDDDISRQVFENRLMMTLLSPPVSELMGEKEYLRNKRNGDGRVIALMEHISKIEGKVLIYGAGECGVFVRNHSMLNNVNFCCFIDNIKATMENIDGLPVMNYDAASDVYNDVTVILSIVAPRLRQNIISTLKNEHPDWEVIDAGEIFYTVDEESISSVNTPFTNNNVAPYTYNLLCTNPLVHALLRQIESLNGTTAYWISDIPYENEPFIRMYESIRERCPWDCFVSETYSGNEYFGLPVYRLDEYIKKCDQKGNLVLSIGMKSEEYEKAKAMLRRKGEHEIIGSIVDMYGQSFTLHLQQYFDFFPYRGTQEAFVDAGVLDLSSSFNFMAWCHGNFEAIYAFEPDKISYNRCYKKASSFNGGVHIFNQGLYDKTGQVRFDAMAGGSSRIVDGSAYSVDDISNDSISVIDLDTALAGKTVTFIKMDIEGSEAKALLGAEKIISTQKPKLAICVYHKPEDIIEIPALVLRMNPEYRIAFRHYSMRSVETVMYAW